MTLSFTRAEYWLLEAVVEQSVCIAGLSSDDAAGWARRSNHDVTQEEMIDALGRLFTEGLIIGERWQSFWTKSRRKIRLKRVEIEAELKRPLVSEDGIVSGYGPLSVYYWLTKKGGAAWESFAHPDWDKFIDGFGSYVEEEDGSRHGEATCPSKYRLEQYVAGAHSLGYEIDQNAIVWDVIRPWRATYWKRLRMAHRVRFPIIKQTEPDWSNMPHYYRELTRWYRWRS